MTKYFVKISEQGQITLPKALRDTIGAKSGTRVVLTVNNDANNAIDVSKKYPVQNYFGMFGDTITGGKDAADYIRATRDETTAKRDKSTK